MRGAVCLFRIVFENENFIVINKPFGISTQENKNYSESIEKSLSDYDGKLKLLPRSGIVHRLDKDTTGLLLIAKSLEYFDFLTGLFKDRRINKTYLSLNQGTPTALNGEISFFLKKNFSHNGKIKMAVDKFDGKYVKLYFEVLSTNSKFSFVKIKPITGRTHQIRLAFEKIHFPIYNDPLYNKQEVSSLEGQYLHAYSLQFTDKNNKVFNFTAPLPDFFINKLRDVGLEENVAI